MLSDLEAGRVKVLKGLQGLEDKLGGRDTPLERYIQESRGARETQKFYGQTYSENTMLNSKAIKQLIEAQQLITGYIDLEKQLQPAGFDLSLKEVHTYWGAGAIDFNNKERKLAATKLLKPSSDGWYTLPQGCYMIVYNEAVKMPLNIVALARSRSTVLRNAAAVETAVWDPGYQGRSSSLLVVHNPQGIRLKQDARLAQLVFYSTDEVEKGYSGVYQNERIK